MTDVVTRSNGITESERYLQKLCEKSFLRLWSYPGVYRDQSSGIGAMVGKEVCDLLVVFEDHIIIFSDKNITFPDTGNIDLDWSRWVSKAVLDSGKQLYGAERWIKQHPDRLYIDRDCKQVFPINLPDLTSAKIHRIVVAHGVSERCKKELGGSGSLMIISTIVGNDHTLLRNNGGIPFAVGQLDPQRGFVHILDDTSLEIVMNTLDTISDFTSYLEKKEVFFPNMLAVNATGEEELLAYYLSKLNDEGEHDFIVDKEINALGIDEGFWDDFVKSDQRKSQLAANRVSYSWDDLIEEFIKNILNDSQYIKDPLGPRNQEKIMRFLAREPRTRRRILMNSFFELLKKTSPSQKSVRIVVPSKKGDPYYVFLIVPHIYGTTESDYRKVRMKLLESYSLVVKHDFPDAEDIVGIATEPLTIIDYRSEDAIYFDARIWTPEQEEESKRLKRDLSLLENTKTYRSKEFEFPSASKKPRKRHKSKK